MNTPTVVMIPAEEPIAMDGPGLDEAQKPTPEQARAAEEVFARQDEAAQVQGLVGLWAGAALLKDLAAEHFRRDEDDEEEQQKERPSGTGL
jgi:hypothetical protein